MSEGAETDADLFGIVARRDGAVWGVSAGALLLLFAQWGHAGLGRIVALSVLTVAILIRLYWPLRDRLWFRATIAGIALFHAFMILFYPWPDDRMAGRTLSALAMLDILAFGLVIWILARKIFGPFKR
jgi:hypothetical protein